MAFEGDQRVHRKTRRPDPVGAAQIGQVDHKGRLVNPAPRMAYQTRRREGGAPGRHQGAMKRPRSTPLGMTTSLCSGSPPRVAEKSRTA